VALRHRRACCCFSSAGRVPAVWTVVRPAAEVDHHPACLSACLTYQRILGALEALRLCAI